MNKWFTDTERALATALLLMGLPIGAGLSYGMTGAWFKNVPADEPREFMEAFKNLMVVQFFMAAAIWIVFNLAIKEKPDKPPSAVAEVQYEALDCKQSLAVLRANRDFLLLLIAYALPYGSFLAIGALMSNVFDPFGFEPSEIAFVLLALLLTGVIGAVVTGAFLDKTKLYKVSMHAITFLIALSTSVLIATLSYVDSKALLVGLLLVGGFFSTGLIPLCFAYGSELTFPLQPALVNGMLSLAGAITSFLLSLLGAFLIKEQPEDEDLGPDELRVVTRFRAKCVVLLMTVAALVALIMSFFIKENLKRLKYSKQEDQDQAKGKTDDEANKVETNKV